MPSKLRAPLASNPLGRRLARQMAPPANNKRLGRPNVQPPRNTMDNNTRQFHSHRQPNSRGAFAPNSRSFHCSKLNKPKSKSKRNTTQNMRAGYAGNDSSYSYHPPPAPHNINTFLGPARHNGGIAFHSPRDYPSFATSPTINPFNPNPMSPTYRAVNPNPRSATSRAINPYSRSATSPAINPNPSLHRSTESDYGCTTPIFHNPSITPPKKGDYCWHLVEENNKVNGEFDFINYQLKSVDRRLNRLELIHNDYASRNINNNNEAVDASSSENSIGN